jgi:hypothetical protein
MEKPDYIMSVLEVLKYIIPAAVVFGIVQYMMKSFFDSEYKRRHMELKVENNKLIMPLKLQAYERMVVLMERMSPNNLIVRVSQPGISATQLKMALIQDINSEYNHNVSQQVYISPQAGQLGNNAVGLDLSRAIFELTMTLDNTPTNKALDFLRKEFHLMYDSFN